MTDIVKILVPTLAVLFFILAVLSVWQARQARTQSASGVYGLDRLSAHQGMQVAGWRAIIFLLLALIFLSVLGLSLRPTDLLATDPEFTPWPTITPLVTEAGVLPTATTGALATATANVLAEPSATAVQLQPTATSIPSATPIRTALVNSEVGLFLREAPGGTQDVELIPNGSTLTLLPGRETILGTEWQEVITPTGNEGWVAAAFIIYQ